MGGIGSGASPRHRKLNTGDGLPLDIRKLNRDGVLTAGAQSTATWPGPASSIMIHAQADSVTLIYSTAQRGNHVAWVRLIRTPCHLGGSRVWWSCPGCHRRVAILYAVSGDFLCRRCNQMVYACQQESPANRAIRQKLKARRKLGDCWYIKPKGMHQKTFDRLVAEFQQCSQKADQLESAELADWPHRRQAEGPANLSKHQ